MGSVQILADGDDGSRAAGLAFKVLRIRGPCLSPKLEGRSGFKIDSTCYEDRSKDKNYLTYLPK